MVVFHGEFAALVGPYHFASRSESIPLMALGHPTDLELSSLAVPIYKDANRAGTSNHLSNSVERASSPASAFDSEDQHLHSGKLRRALLDSPIHLECLEGLAWEITDAPNLNLELRIVSRLQKNSPRRRAWICALFRHASRYYVSKSSRLLCIGSLRLISGPLHLVSGCCGHCAK